MTVSVCTQFKTEIILSILCSAEKRQNLESRINTVKTMLKQETQITRGKTRGIILILWHDKKIPQL